MTSINIQIPQPVQNILDKLNASGHQAYIVGGSVRDAILGKTPHDYDICTDAKPNEIVKIFESNKPILSGMKHGTVTPIINGEPYEITTYRIDGAYSDGRRPDSVTFTKSIDEDLKRRDFTINAMAYNPKDGLVDPFGGMHDIKQKLIKCVGNPDDRFTEDALRTMRALRFASQLDFRIDSNTANAIHTHCKNLDNVSMERINSEFVKTINGKTFPKLLEDYSDVFATFIPELKDMIDFPQNNPYHEYNAFMHTVHALENCNTNDTITRLAIFFHDIGKPHSYQDEENGVRHFYGHPHESAIETYEIMTRLRFDNITRDSVVELVENHDAQIEPTDKSIKRQLNKLGEVQLKRLLDVKRADIKGQKRMYNQGLLQKVNSVGTTLDKVLEEQSCFMLKSLAVNGNDVKQIMNIKEGRQVGQTLNTMLEKVMDGELKNDRESLTDWMAGLV